LDEAVKGSVDYSERSQFIRDAIIEMAEQVLHVTIPRELALPPGRAGKGGRQPKTSAAPVSSPATVGATFAKNALRTSIESRAARNPK